MSNTMSATSTKILPKETLLDPTKDDEDKSDVSSEGSQDDDLESIDEEDKDDEEMDEDGRDEDDEEDGHDEDDEDDIVEEMEDLDAIQDNDDDDDDALADLENEEDEPSYQKLEDYVISQDLEKLHPEIQSVNYEEIASLARIVRDAKGNIIDPLHTTAPFLTKYEKARIIGTRAEQLERGAPPLVELEQHIIQGRTIAMMEFEQKKIPFIIARPLPNKAVEYWRVSDLECI